MAQCCPPVSVARCVSSVAFSLLRVACGVVSAAHSPVVHCTLSLACRLRHAVSGLVSNARCLLSLFGRPPPCPLPAWCVLSVARSHVASRLVHVLRCESPVVCCIVHVLGGMLSLFRCLSHLACRHTVTLATRMHTSTHARTHARTHTSVCSRSRRPLRRSLASAAAVVRA